MTRNQSVHLSVECGLLTDSQVPIKVAFSLLCHSAPCTGARLELQAYGARSEQPGVVSQQWLTIFILNFDGAALPHCFLSQFSTIFSQGFCPRLIFFHQDW